MTGGREKVPAKGRFSTGRDGCKAMLAARRKFLDRTQAVGGCGGIRPHRAPHGRGDEGDRAGKPWAAPSGDPGAPWPPPAAIPGACPQLYSQPETSNRFLENVVDCRE